MKLEQIRSYDEIIIVSYSAGGGNLLCSYLRENRDTISKVKFLVQGPSLKIFQEFINETNTLTLEDLALLENKNVILFTGLSGNHPLELLSLEKAHQHKLATVSILDHWVNYKMRFLLEGKTIYPDWIFICDEDAKMKALEVGLPSEKLVQVENLYFLEMSKRYQALDLNVKKGKKRIIFLCEYLDTAQPNPSKNDFIEEVVLLDEFIKGIYTENNDQEYEVDLRLHPSEHDDKYDILLERYDIVKKRDRGNELVFDLAESDIVVGYQSLALVLAAHLGKKVFSIERGVRILPNKDIVYIKNFKQLVES